MRADKQSSCCAVAYLFRGRRLQQQRRVGRLQLRSRRLQLRRLLIAGAALARFGVADRLLFRLDNHRQLAVLGAQLVDGLCSNTSSESKEGTESVTRNSKRVLRHET